MLQAEKQIDRLKKIKSLVSAENAFIEKENEQLKQSIVAATQQ